VIRATDELQHGLQPRFDRIISLKISLNLENTMKILASVVDHPILYRNTNFISSYEESALLDTGLFTITLKHSIFEQQTEALRNTKQHSACCALVA
jgi:hypothetical protein